MAERVEEVEICAPDRGTERITTEPQPVGRPEPDPPHSPQDSRPAPTRIVPPRDGLLPAAQSLLSVLAVALFITTFTVQPVRIPSSSMEPTLLVGDFLLLDKQPVLGTAGGLLPPATIQHDDVIVFHDPADDPSVELIKRVIGLPGDRIHLRDGVVYRNGVALREPFAVHRASATDLYRDDFPNLQTLDLRVDPAWWIALRRLAPTGELTVPPGKFFVLGDNRNDSEDSRYWGFVSQDAIVGRPVLIYFSWRQADNPEDSVTSVGHGDALHKRGLALRPVSGLLDFARWDRTFRVVR